MKNTKKCLATILTFVVALFTSVQISSMDQSRNIQKSRSPLTPNEKLRLQQRQEQRQQEWEELKQRQLHQGQERLKQQQVRHQLEEESQRQQYEQHMQQIEQIETQMQQYQREQKQKKEELKQQAQQIQQRREQAQLQAQQIQQRGEQAQQRRERRRERAPQQQASIKQMIPWEGQALQIAQERQKLATHQIQRSSYLDREQQLQQQAKLLAELQTLQQAEQQQNICCIEADGCTEDQSVGSIPCKNKHADLVCKSCLSKIKNSTNRCPLCNEPLIDERER